MQVLVKINKWLKIKGLRLITSVKKKCYNENKRRILDSNECYVIKLPD